MAGGRMFVMNIDTSGAMAIANEMKNKLSPEKMEKVIHDTNVDTMKKVKTIVGKVAAGGYQVTQAWAKKHVGPYIASGLSAEIPLNGARGVIGGVFPMSTGRGNVRTKSGRKTKSRIVKSAKIKRGKTSMLPALHPHQGGNPIFPLKGVAVTRTGKGGTARVVGRALPQMIAESPHTPEFEEQLKTYIEERIVHHINRALG